MSNGDQGPKEDALPLVIGYMQGDGGWLLLMEVMGWWLIQLYSCDTCIDCNKRLSLIPECLDVKDVVRLLVYGSTVGEPIYFGFNSMLDSSSVDEFLVD